MGVLGASARLVGLGFHPRSFGFRGLGFRVVSDIQGLGVWGVFGVSSRLVGF